MGKFANYFGLFAAAIAGGYFLYDEYQGNLRDKTMVRDAPIIEAYTQRPIQAICKDEGGTENLTVLCREQFRKDNGISSFANITPSKKFNFRDIDRDGKVGKRPDLVKIVKSKQVY